jgi:hypothetical protein
MRGSVCLQVRVVSLTVLASDVHLEVEDRPMESWLRARAPDLARLAATSRLYRTMRLGGGGVGGGGGGEDEAAADERRAAEHYVSACRQSISSYVLLSSISISSFE